MAIEQRYAAMTRKMLLLLLLMDADGHGTEGKLTRAPAVALLPHASTCVSQR